MPAPDQNPPSKSLSARRRRGGKGRTRPGLFWRIMWGPIRWGFRHGFMLSMLMLAVIMPLCLIYGVRAMKVDLRLVREMPKASIVYDRNGQQLGRFFEQNRVPLPEGELPALLKHAIIATEDQRFYYHPGIDPLGIARAAIANLTPGGNRQGGSTITQQLARNSINMLERTYDRKMLEIFLAIRIEAGYSKDEILRHYLDRIYYGHGLYGAQTAAQAFFGKSVHDLSLGEAALLAGIVSGPNTFSPWNSKTKANYQRTIAVRNESLDRMYRRGFASKEEVEAAKAEPLALKPKPDFGGNYAMDEVRRQLRQFIPLEQLNEGGLKIFTTVDYGLQHKAEEVVAEQVAAIERTKSFRNRHGGKGAGQLQAAFYAVSPDNGAIRAVVGGRGYRQTQFNRATQARRQVGSTLKPLIYAVAFQEKNYSPATKVSNKQFDLKRAKPNLNPTGGDYIRINEALVKSDNYAAVRVGNFIGPESFVYYAQQAGIRSSIPPYQSSYLGACDLSVAEMTTVYATLINGGVWEEPHIVNEVRTNDETVLYRHKPASREVFSPQVARQVVGMMENVVENANGTAHRLRTAYGFERPVAGKTGTTNDYKDAWFIGGTSHLVAGVWVGFDQPKTISSGGYGARAALPIWAGVFNAAQDHYPMQKFPVPVGLERRTLGGGVFSNAGPREVVYLKPEQDWQINAGGRESSSGEKPKGFFEQLFDW
ncbi:MAG: transglycosylase domain-containing protein [Verrucomicrobiota bacterium]